MSSASALAESANLSTVACGDALPCGGEDIGHARLADALAIGVRQILPVAGNLLVARERIPFGQLRLGWRERRGPGTGFGVGGFSHVRHPNPDRRRERAR